MDVAARIFLVGIYGAIIGMIGAFLLIYMIDKSNGYISNHPPDKKEKDKKGDPEK